jgi:putative transposase
VSRKTYDSPRLREVLKAQGIGVGRRRISRPMTAHGLQPKAKRRFVPRTTHRNRRGLIAANLLQQRDAPPARINKVWVKDITYIPTVEGWLYLDATLDLCSRRVLGWHAATTMPAQHVINSLRQAYRSRGAPLHGLIVHTDRVCQYACESYRADLNLATPSPALAARAIATTTLPWNRCGPRSRPRPLAPPSP